MIETEFSAAMAKAIDIPYLASILYTFNSDIPMVFPIVFDLGGCIEALQVCWLSINMANVQISIHIQQIVEFFGVRSFGK